MKKNYLGMAMMCAGVWMASCSENKSAMTLAELAGEWTIVNVAGEKADGASQAFIGLDIEGKRLYGNAGCNRVMGAIELDSTKNGSIIFTKVGSTRMMCPDMDLETKVMAALGKVAGYEKAAEGLAFVDAEGKEVMTLARRAEQVSVNDLAGEWIIKSAEGVAPEDLDKTPFLSFDVTEMTVHGNGGCNILNGSFSHDESQAASLKFGLMISTMMAGPGMDFETNVLKAMEKVRSFALTGTEGLNLLDENETVVLSLEKNKGKKLAE